LAQLVGVGDDQQLMERNKILGVASNETRDEIAAHHVVLSRVWVTFVNVLVTHEIKKSSHIIK
jgi:hypothetical protein